MSARRFEGKVVLVTGGGSGLGRGTALAFAREGATVVVAGRGEGQLAETVQAIEEAGGTGSYVVADVTKEEDARRMVETTVERHGSLDVAYNNAGVLGRPAPLADVDLADWQHVMDVNVTGVFLSMQAEIRYMRDHGGGAIVNTSSNIGAHGRRENLGAYAASKAAVSVLTRAAARDHIGDGIRINAVSPGASDAPMSYRPGESATAREERLRDEIPLGRHGSVDEVASAVLWLASEESGFAVGHDLVVDGGVTA